MGQGSASSDKLWALLGEVEGLLQRTDLEDAEDLAAAIERIAQAKPELADEAWKLAAEAGDSLDDSVRLTRDLIKHATLNLRRLLRFLTVRHDFKNKGRRIKQFAYNAQKKALARSLHGQSACWADVPVELSPDVHAQLLGAGVRRMVYRT